MFLNAGDPWVDYPRWTARALLAVTPHRRRVLIRPNRFRPVFSCAIAIATSCAGRKLMAVGSDDERGQDGRQVAKEKGLLNSSKPRSVTNDDWLHRPATYRI